MELRAEKDRITIFLGGDIVHNLIANEIVAIFTKNGLSIREVREVMTKVLVMLSERPVR